MPQPLSRVTPNANFEIGNVGTRPLSQRPELAIMAMEVIASWSHVESFMMQMYIELAGGLETDAAAVFLALETTTAKSAAINVLAKRKLPADHVILLRAIIKIIKSGQKERDKLAHWIWGTSENIPDAILLADPRAIPLTKNDIYVYKAIDFEKHENKI